MFVDELTGPELQERIRAGTTTVIIPIGATEQNGPHMVLGKHNVRVQALSARIAQQLGNALVAPVVSYVPEGSINPPTAHMRFPGTTTVPVAVFEQVHRVRREKLPPARLSRHRAARRPRRLPEEPGRKSRPN